MVELWLAACTVHVTSPGHQCLHFIRTNQQQAGGSNGKPCFFLCLFTGTPWKDKQAAPQFSFPLVRLAWTLKGGLMSIATQELLLDLQPSPPGLDHGIATWHTSGG